MLHVAQVFVLLNAEPGPNGEWVEGTEVLVLKNEADEPVIAMFSAPERAAGWPENAPGYDHGLLVAFRWLLGGVVPGVGIVLNPGSEIGVEISPTLVKKLQDAAGQASA